MALDGDEILRVERLAVRFASPAGPVDAVKDMSFRIRQGSCVAIVGESGSGKSVTARAILGILASNGSIDGGNIWFRDPNSPDTRLDLTTIEPQSLAYRRIRGGRISMIFQEPMTSLSPLHTIGDQIFEMLELHSDLKGKAREARAIDMLKLVRFPTPERAIKSYPFELSGGLRQRAMIAMSIVCSPALLIADEPTTALDVTVQAQILGLIKNLQSEMGMAVLLITHDMGVVANMADEVVVVYRGVVRESGTIQDLLNDPQHPYLKGLLAAVPRMGDDPERRLQSVFDAPARPDDATAESDAVPTANGAIGEARCPVAMGEPILAVRNVRKTYELRSGGGGIFGSGETGEVVAVDDASFDVRAGECLAVVGESGSGKTTVAKLIMGAVSCTRGSIILEPGTNREADLTALSERQLIPVRRRLQYIFQDPFGSLNPRMTTFDILREPLDIHGIGTPAERKARVQEMMRDVGLNPRFLNRYPHSFSGGQRQRIGIARALMLKPEIVLCDEPVSALDVSTQAQILNLLKDLQRRLQLTYVFISHDFAVVNYIADRIAVMCRGRIVELADRDQLFANPIHPYTRALLSCVPSPDLAHPLDFDQILSRLDTEPAGWDAPFDVRDDVFPPMVSADDGHQVRTWDIGASLKAAQENRPPAGSAPLHGDGRTQAGGLTAALEATTTPSELVQ